MKKMMCMLCLLWAAVATAQEKYTINGHIKDLSSGEELLGATILVKELSTGTTTNLYGFYSLTLPKGDYTLVYSFVGYQPITQSVALYQDIKSNIELPPGSTLLTEFEVTGEAKDENVQSVEMSTINMKMETIKKIPSLMGEVDVIKAIQMLPGVQTVGEGNSGFYVRGGGVDQNLILLDEAPVYNASHLLGFFSVFNSDALKDVQLYKGGIPAEYGGRLSSVLDIRMKDGNSKRFAATGGLGTVSSRLTLEGPIEKDKSSFIVSGRRTYADVFLKLAKDTNLRQNKLYFYDLNAKANFTLNDNNKLYLSSYFGRDVFAFSDQFRMSWGNATGTLRWNHIYNKKLFSNLTLLYSDYDYYLGDLSGADAFGWTSRIRDYSMKMDFNSFPNPNNTVKYGLQSTYHVFDPGIVTAESSEAIFNDFKIPQNKSLEHAIYISNEQRITPRLSAIYGIRASVFQNIGKTTYYRYDSNYNAYDTVNVEAGKVFNVDQGLEPRLGMKYSLTEEKSIKLSYNRMVQYIHLASNSTSASPLDIWFPSSPNVAPQLGDQIALGYFQNFNNNTYEFSVEGYYKKMSNQIDFKDHAELLLNSQLEGELRFGEGYAYGMEFFLKRREGRFTGWLSYTLARAERKIKEINNGEVYPTKYDKTHDISLVMSYTLNKRWDFSANWVFSTGSAVTMPTGRFEFQGVIVPVYSDRNAARLPAYHRMDISATLKNKQKEGKKWKGEWVFSVYNAYMRKNAFQINFRQDENDPTITHAEKLYLFSIVPAVTYNFKF